MNEEKTKKILLTLLVIAIMGGAIFTIVYTMYSPIKELKSNNTIEISSYKNDINDANTHVSSDNNKNGNILSDIDITTSQVDDGNASITTQIIETEIAKYSTTIYDKEENRIHNIKLATSKLDGTIIEPGEEFSFNNAVGKMGKNEGYKKATGFNGNGKKVKIYGGGMCQISSTLYNAALIAKFEITERHPHSRRVYYVPKNKDATVSYGGADLKFKNNRDKKVKILATTDGHNVTIKLIEIG